MELANTVTQRNTVIQEILEEMEAFHTKTEGT